MAYRGPNRPQTLPHQSFVTTLVAATAQTVNVPVGVRTAVFNKSTTDALSVAIDVAIDTSPTAAAGTQVATFNGITGATAIALADYAGGYQVVDVGGAKTLATATGIANTGTVYTASVNVDGADTAGFQVVDVGGAKAGGTATGLANDATVYTATVDVDDAASPQAISIVGSAAQTYTTLIAELDADTTGASWSIVGGNLRATSALLGLGSAIDIVDTDLFLTLTDFVAIDAPVDAADDFAISVVGTAVQTYADLIAEINADITGAVASLVAGDLRITRDSTLVTSAIDIENVDLFDALTDFAAVNAATAAVQIDYDMTVAIDGNAPTAVSLNAGDFTTYTELAADIDTAIGGAGAAAVVDGSTILITSDTTGSASSILIADTNLLSSIPEFLQVETALDGNIPQANFLQNPDALDVSQASTIDIESAGTPVVHISFY